MKRIISQNIDMTESEDDWAQPSDFQDVQVRRLDGAIAETVSLLQDASGRMAQIRAKQPRISYLEIMQDEQVSYALRQVKFTISGFLDETNGGIGTL